MSVKQIMMHYMTGELAQIFNAMPEAFFEGIEEIRFRVNKPIIITYKGAELFVDENGNSVPAREGYRPDREQILKAMELICNYSLYAFEEELRNGYLTLPGGHRVGVTGKTVVEQNSVKTIKNINSLNIRISHEIKGCADPVLHYVTEGNLLHTMIISPPGCGKTTLLRDMVRQLSDGIPGRIPGQAIGVADERSEIAGCYMGIPQNDVGLRTDVLDGCPKAEGMIMLLRSMSPKIIAVDEIGKKSDIHAIDDIINGGITLLCTVHGSSLKDVNEKPVLAELLSKNIFRRFVILDKPGSVKAIYNENQQDIYHKK